MRDLDHNPVVAIRILQFQRHRFVALASKIKPHMRSGMRCDELSQFGLLLVLGKVLGAIDSINQFADRIIRAVDERQRRALLVSFLSRID